MFSPFGSTEPSAEECGPSTSQLGYPRPEAPHSPPSAAAAASTRSLMDKKLEMDVLKQQKIVRHLQEEYYKLQIELLKKKIINNGHLCLHNIFLTKNLAFQCGYDFYIAFTVTCLKCK